MGEKKDCRWLSFVYMDFVYIHLLYIIMTDVLYPQALNGTNELTGCIYALCINAYVDL